MVIRDYYYALILHIPIECWILSLTSIINSWFYFELNRLQSSLEGVLSVQ